MNDFALEASVVGAWLLEDEEDPVASATVARVATEFAPLPDNQPEFGGAGEEA